MKKIQNISVNTSRELNVFRLLSCLHNTPKLTVNELPSHSHNYSYPGYEAGGEWYGASGTAKGNTVATTAVGGGAAHENRPPYYAVYIWRRTA